MRETLCFSVVSWLRRFAKVGPKNGSCGGSAAQDVDKIYPRLRARPIWKSKSLKTGGPGALLEVDIDKICTTPARQSDLYEKKAPRCMFGALLEVELPKICTTPAHANDSEVKIVKTPGARDVF